MKVHSDLCVEIITLLSQTGIDMGVTDLLVLVPDVVGARDGIESPACPTVPDTDRRFPPSPRPASVPRRPVACPRAS